MRTTSTDELAVDAINVRLLAEGWGAAIACWLFLGLSLWATLRAIGVDGVSPIYDLPMLVAVVAMAVVAGFISMLPGGLGVRDLALVQLLAEYCSPADALVAAVIMRLVWLVSELAVCVILYVAARMGQKRSSAA
jgi:glycosyltransferase 2 family protein